MTNFSATVTDSYGLSAHPTTNATVTGSNGVRTRTLRFLGETFGGSYGATSFGNLEPEPGKLSVNDPSPYELGMAVQFQFSGNIIGVNFFKSDQNTGPHSVSVWKTDGTKLNTTACDPNYDVDGVIGWVYQTLSSPVAVNAGDTLVVSYTCPSGFYSTGGTFMIDDAHYPFMVSATTPSYFKAGGSGFPNVTSGSWFFVGLDFSYTTTEPALVYSNYMSQFTNGPSPNNVCISVFSADPPFDQYKAAGFTNVRLFDFTNSVGEANSAGMKATALGNVNTGTVQQSVASSPTAAATIEMYTLDDELDIEPGGGGNEPPATVQQYVARYRAYDSTRPIILNLGKFSVSAAYVWSTNTYPWKANWDYFASVDIPSADAYCLTDNTLGAVGSGPPGIWGYSRAAQKLADYVHGSKPVAFFVETVLSDNVPSPSDLYKAVWSGIIGGGRILQWFDHNFGSTQVDDYILSNPTQYAGVQAINTLVQSLAQPILGPGQDGIVSSVTSSNNTQTHTWGVTGVPIQYTVRKDNSGNFYIFSQPYRPGTTNSTWTVPCAANATITVVNESRTLTADSSGHFTDSYTNDYQVHLYKWTPTSTPTVTVTDDVFPKIFYPAPPSLGPPDTADSFFGTAIPGTIDGGDGQSITVALKFTPNVNGHITEVRYYKSAANIESAPHQGAVWTNGSTTPLIQETFSTFTTSGWQKHTFSTPIAVTAGTTYWIGVFMHSGHYSYDPATYPFTNTSGNLTANSSGYYYSASMQTDSTQFINLGSHNAYIDLGFVTP